MKIKKNQATKRNLTITTFNPYPEETISRNALPKESPLHQLSYGLLSEKLLPKIKTSIRKKRKRDIEFYIKNTNNHLLNIAFNDILRDAKALHTYKTEDWRVGNKTKKERIELMLKNDISLNYIREAFCRQIIGPLKFKPGNLIIIPVLTSEPSICKIPTFGIITKVQKKTIRYVKVCTYFDYEEEEEFDKNLNYNLIKPIWWKPHFSRYTTNINGSNSFSLIRTSSIWNIRYRGHITEKIRDKFVDIYYIFKKRYNLVRWSNLIKTMPLQIEYYNDYTFDIFKGELSDRIKETIKTNIEVKDFWTNVLSEAKRYEIKINKKQD